ncbi:MAG TPA: BPSS1780 family membrane protein [Thiobacillaceae bacterium]|nr:BPSS1780 family membrane protein [Thiobacillaceae bacterium]
MAVNEELPRKLPAAAGLRWVTDAFRLFRKNPLLLAAAFGLFMGALLAISLIPIAGAGLTDILTPLVVAGFMAAFRALDRNEELELPQLFTGFVSRPLPLATVGAIYLACALVIGKIMELLGLDSKAIMDAAQQNDAEKLMPLLEQGATALLVGLTLLTPLVMATWLAPPLVLFGNALPLQALGISIKACWRNWLPLLVYGVVLIPILLVAALIPMLLGMLVAGPILMGSLYTAYQDIFAVQREHSLSQSG